MALFGESAGANVSSRVVFGILVACAWVIGLTAYGILYCIRRKQAARQQQLEEAAQARGVQYGGATSPYGGPYGGPPVVHGAVVAYQEAPAASTDLAGVPPAHPGWELSNGAWRPSQQPTPLYPGVVVEQQQQPGNTTDAANIYGTAYYYTQPNEQQTAGTEPVKPL
ncbi:hypothetical_protein [Leishmania infantum]|uniref:Hypothetical_protein n=1 Tax=Leishmania infantum TaxID=5671 RepID=A0A6L0XM68_LEIIN|nr:hypothetical_protein [Leishmania infantum]SUZ44414.1 hypothetical_protein [Leishmania infantum]